MSSQLVSHQVSGNTWEKTSFAMLHESFEQHSTSKLVNQVSIFENLEALEQKMFAQEAEFQSSLECLKKKFIFHHPQAVSHFLKYHRALVTILLESVTHLLECFSSDAPLSLEVMSDEGLPTEIYALVLWREDRSKARVALQKFDELWWGKNLRRSDGKIVFDYELL